MFCLKHYDLPITVIKVLNKQVDVIYHQNNVKMTNNSLFASTYTL